MNTTATVVNNCTLTYISTIYSLLSSYTLSDDALTHYNFDSEDSDDLPDEAYRNEEWMQEYELVCAVSPDSTLPAIASNTSIILEIDTDTALTGPTGTLSTASATATSATATATASGLSISPDGTCGDTMGYTCASSAFGDYCSIYECW
ncbi:hypothetical protein ACLOAV_009678 [Pseudogymnoascus australis]